MDNQTVMDSALDMASRMDMMMNMILDLTNKVNGKGKEPAVQLELPQHSPAKARHETSRSRHKHTSFQELDWDETVWCRVEQHIFQILWLEATTWQEDSASHNKYVVKRKKTNLKSGRDHMGVTSVERWITWPHEVTYAVDGQPVG